MAVTGVNNYSNIYTNAYTGNIRKNNAKETTEKQVVEQTEDVKTGTTRKTAADELSYLSKKFDNYSFVSANYSPGMKYGKSTTTNVAISPQFLTKMVNDSDLEDEYIKEIGNMKKLDEQFAKQQADIGWRVEQGWAIDKDGNISSWAIGHKDSKVKSFLQNMSEKAEEILQKQLEKAKDTKEGNADRDTLSQIEKLLNEGDNAKNIWTHAWICMHDSDNEIVNSQANRTKANQYSLWHEVYETTGYDARNATYRNGTFIAEDGTDLLALFKEKAKNGAGYELYSNRWLEYAKNGWKKENDLVLKIGFDSSGLYDIGQERGYGATQNMWMKGISQSIFEASV